MRRSDAIVEEGIRCNQLDLDSQIIYNRQPGHVCRLLVIDILETFNLADVTDDAAMFRERIGHDLPRSLHIRRSDGASVRPLGPGIDAKDPLREIFVALPAIENTGLEVFESLIKIHGRHPDECLRTLLIATTPHRRKHERR